MSVVPVDHTHTRVCVCVLVCVCVCVRVCVCVCWGMEGGRMLPTFVAGCSHGTYGARESSLTVEGMVQSN